MEATAFDAFYTASFSRVVGQVYAMCGDFAEAQDCVQEAFVRAWDHHRQLEHAHAPEAWVRTVAWRLAVSRWRRARRALAPPDRSRLPQAPAEPDVDHTAVVAALKQIPEEQRRAIDWRRRGRDRAHRGDAARRRVERAHGVPNAR